MTQRTNTNSHSIAVIAGDGIGTRGRAGGY